MILDSNIVIYANSSTGAQLLEWTNHERRVVSEITRLEVLDYHRLDNDQRQLLTLYIRECSILPVTSTVIDEAIRLRQIRKMDLGDAIIAATALVYRETLTTANTTDFKWVPGLSLLNPLDLLKPAS